MPFGFNPDRSKRKVAGIPDFTKGQQTSYVEIPSIGGLEVYTASDDGYIRVIVTTPESTTSSVAFDFGVWINDRLVKREYKEFPGNVSHVMYGEILPIKSNDVVRIYKDSASSNVKASVIYYPFC